MMSDVLAKTSSQRTLILKAILKLLFTLFGKMTLSYWQSVWNGSSPALAELNATTFLPLYEAA